MMGTGTLPRIGSKPYRLAMSDGAARGTKRLRAVQIGVALLLLIVIFSVVKRFVIDMPNLAAGTLPEDEFDHRYVQQPWLAYLHLTPGVLYLLGAPLQLAYRFRSRDLRASSVALALHISTGQVDKLSDHRFPAWDPNSIR